MGVNEEDFNEGAVLFYDETDQPKVRSNPSKKSRGIFHEFLSMGLYKPVFDGIKYIDYKRPTPIQKAAIPVIRSGQDVVAMARTGSGKTAAFLIPMFEMLKRHSPTQGPRALILEPTRELADQTLRFTKKLGRFTGLHCTLIVGGDSMTTQFDALHQHPDILIATPGRLMHICVEMNLSLDNIQYIVFDEADRLFELGFRDQLEEILSRLAPTRQTLLFSATLPQMIAEFAKAGLTNPTLIRLDKDEKLSEQLQLAFFSVTPYYKLHLLLYIVQKILKEDEQMIVFASTQVEVQFLQCIFEKFDIPCTFLYSEMDPSSRKINTAQFQKRVVNVLLATDIAARGIDIPNLDYVLNYNFPGDAKTFVHRVGRAARAGKCGVALSFVSLDEEPYLWDLHKFLGRSVKFSPMFTDPTTGDAVKLDMNPDHDLATKYQEEKDDSQKSLTFPNQGLNQNWDYQFGTVPSDIFEEENAQIRRLLHNDEETQYIAEKSEKSYKVYTTSRPKASKAALHEMRATRQIMTPGIHPFLMESVKLNIKKYECMDDSGEMFRRRQILLGKLHNARPAKTIFEIGIKGSRKAGKTMQLKRKRDDSYISQCQDKLNEMKSKYDNVLKLKAEPCKLPQMTEDDIFYEFRSTVTAQDEIQMTVAAKNQKIIEEEEKKERKRQRKSDKIVEKFGPGAAVKKEDTNKERDDNKNQKIIEEEEKTERKRQKKSDKIVEKFGPGAAVKKEDKNKERDDKLETNVKQGFFIPYQPANLHTERGYSINTNFAKQSKEAQLELMQDDHAGIRRAKLIKTKWDTKKDKFTGKRVQEKKIKTESGRIIRSSYKTDRYDVWMRRNKIEKAALEAASNDPDIVEPVVDESTKRRENTRFKVLNKKIDKVHPLLAEHNKKLVSKGQKVREEVLNTDQMKKQRMWQKRYAADRERGIANKKTKDMKTRKDAINRKKSKH